ncbi:ParA family protein [archaeon]|nr:MAG: ParA family protein [archaeon]
MFSSSQSSYAGKRARGDDDDDDNSDSQQFLFDMQDDGSLVDPDDKREKFCIVNVGNSVKRDKIEGKEDKVKIIANWNFKGGVGKTTSSFGLAYAFCEKKNCKVMMVDADPQKNLTQLISRYYRSRYFNNPTSLAPIEDALNEANCGFHRAMNRALKSNRIEPASLIAVDIEDSPDLDADWDPKFRGHLLRDKLFLLPGSFATSLLERELYCGYEYNPGTSDAPRVGGYPAVFWNLIRRTAAVHNIEYVIVDLSPAFSVLNTNIIFSSNLFVVPCAPERFSIEALRSIPSILAGGNFFQKHIAWMKRFERTVQDSKDLGIDESYLKFPTHAVQFAGVMITRFPYKSIALQNNADNDTKYVFQPSSDMVSRFIDEIYAQSVVLAQSLPRCVTRIVSSLNWVNNHELELGRFPEFHQLGLIAQNSSIPCGYLTNRLMKVNNVTRLNARRCRYHHRESLEIIVDKLCDNFLNAVDLVPIEQDSTEG